jgi:two-component system cell cycle sensor histidine kinase/response regulator CckA
VPDVAAEPEAAWRLAAIVESSDDAMIGKTLDGVITSWNAGAELLYGYTLAEILGSNVSVLLPPDRQDELPALLERVASGKRVEHYETERLHKNGTIFDVSVTISPIRDRSSSNIVGASTVTRDISGRKRAEAELSSLQERLHQAQRLESVGQLAGGIAHDFNNLLAGIMNYATLVADGLEQLSARLGLGEDEEVITLAQDVAEITSVSARAAQLTRQLLIFSRHEAAKPEILDLNSVVIDMEKLLVRTLGKSIALTTDLAPDLPSTWADRGQIEQVLMNLVVNARDAMSGGGSLRIETSLCEADSFWSSRHGTGLCVCLIVTDSGCGMPPAVKARAFEPFFTTKQKAEGSGLGLATVYGIVTQAGGEVAILSDPGRGATVRVELPGTDDCAATAREVLPLRPAASLGETILLVEDEATVRESAERILTRHGYPVLAASNAEEALRIANAHPGRISLLLTDVVMPGRSGKDLAAELSRLRPEVNVLYMSGYSRDLLDPEGILDEGVSLIEKPFVADDLLRGIRQILDT